MMMEAVALQKESMPSRPGPLDVVPVVREVKKESRACLEEPPKQESRVETQNAALLKDVLEVVKDHVSVRDIGLEFSVHEDTGRMQVSVTDKETGKVIREIPSERMLDLIGKMEEMVGILFDATA